MHINNKILFVTKIICTITIFYIILCIPSFTFPSYAQNSKPVVVIDPGHGGENLGTEYKTIEKELTLKVGMAMYEELQKYDDITVYLTRDEDTELSLSDRSDFAKEKNADLFISLHFNESLNHTLYGSEVWVSAFGDNYTQGYIFGNEVLNNLDSLNIFRRGIKTRLNEKGTDYYGVIKGCTKNNIPSCIIEHCHVDRVEDSGNFESDEALETLGKLDADAVAKYFHLKSKELNKNYSNYELLSPEVTFVDGKVAPDSTSPEVAQIIDYEIIEPDTNDVPFLQFTIEGSDQDSGLLYYDFSIDDGITYSSLQPFKGIPGEYVSQLNEIPLPYNQKINFICRVYNGYDLYTETQPYHIEPISNSILNLEDEIEVSHIESQILDVEENESEIIVSDNDNNSMQYDLDNHKTKIDTNSSDTNVVSILIIILLILLLMNILIFVVYIDVIKRNKF